MQTSLNLSLARVLHVYGDHTGIFKLAHTGIPPLQLTKYVHLAQLHCRLTMTRPDTLSALLFKKLNSSLPLPNLHTSTQDYHIRYATHTFKIDLQLENDPLPHITSQPPKNRERAFRNMMRKFVSDLWKGQLYNAARTHAGQPPGRKASYIQIANDDLQRLDLFKPAQFLRIPHNQLPLLRLRAQATNYIPTHLHLSNTDNYTPYAERYCLSCLPLQIPGDETHTLLHCPNFSPLNQPAIHSLMLNLRQFDRWAWATYTDTQKVAMLLGSIPPKLYRQHEKAWVLLTLPTCTQLIYSLQSHSRLTQLSVFPVPSPLTTISFPPPPDDIHCQVPVCQSPFDEHQMLLPDICNTAWHMDCLLPPLTTIQHGTWKCPLCIPRHLSPQTATRHLRLPSPILDFDSDKNI